jgi:hypothetical protein
VSGVRRDRRLLLVALVSGLLIWSGVASFGGEPANAAGPLVTGRWRVQPTPSAPTGWSILQAVSCARATSCVAVGYRLGDEGVYAGLAQRWDGSAWTQSPMHADDDEVFNAVSCAATTFCIAVGNAVGYMYPSPIASSWDGQAWTDMHGLHRDVGYLSAVSCTSVRFCAAVGGTGQDFDPLMQIWDGTRWRARLFGTGPEDQLNGVSCASTTFCLGVGDSSGRNSMIALRWNGRTWHWQKLPKLRHGIGLAVVSCPSTHWCIAVGYDMYGHSGAMAILDWNGKSWHQQPLPVRLHGGQLSGISCVSKFQCLVVGWPSLVRRNGQWLSTRPATPAGTDGDPTAVDYPSVRQCVAVGSYGRPGSDTLWTLAETYTWPWMRRGLNRAR